MDDKNRSIGYLDTFARYHFEILSDHACTTLHSSRLRALGLGDPLENTNTLQSTRGNRSTRVSEGTSYHAAVPTLTGHPLTPLLMSNIRLFTSGLVIEKFSTGKESR